MATGNETTQNGGEKYKKAQEEARKRRKEEDPEKYKKDQEEARRRKLEQDQNYYNEAKRKTREKQQENTDETQRRHNFSRAVLLGPIFICSCCERCLFENGVTKITAKFKEKVEAQLPSEYERKNVNKLEKILRKTITDAANFHIGVKRIKNSAQPAITKEIMKAMEERNL